MRKIFFIFCFLIVFDAYADIDFPERRKDQFPTDSGHYFFPAPYSIPGIGEGVIAIGAMTNAAYDYADFYGFAITGDLEGYGLLATDLHLLEKQLILDVSVQNFNKASIPTYSQRGMNTVANDYVLAELDTSDYYGGRLTWTGFDRKLEVYGLYLNNKTRLSAIRDRGGNLIQAAVDAKTNKSESYSYGLRLDLTDDYQDPRRGIRLESSVWHSPPKDDDDPDYDIIELNLTGYIPIGKRDTLVLNYFQADTHVSNTGETNPAIVESNLGLDCSAVAQAAQQDCQNIVNDRVAANTFGSVGALGGLSRLRSYPEDRFNGSHARFWGVEYRWNIVEESKPFDFFFAKDIRTVIQFAIFYERGAISDNKDELWDTMRYSTGIGARLVTSSGLIFRADVGTGDEGEELSIIIGYPWEVF